jgi:DNA polymerase-3 subunit gamma/tau
MSYVALYRKWRPTQFKDVVGQEHITTTLKNQIIYNRIAHAYLFTGTRGTGKTSMAKIFAKAVNCTQHVQGEPCGHCEICQEIESTRVMDILEIDAASNNGVDEIRELREKVKYPTSLGRFKVYIIDEVHMLSQGAFNALLKTLEEPPKHVIFILATTEPHKLPATILSRCQRFDFKRVSVKNMVIRMDYICKEMNITIEEKALELVAKKAEGALRDALSILDQCISLGENNQTISYQNIVDTLGIATEGWLYDISQGVLEQNTQKTIELLHQMIDGGKDIIQIVKQLTEYFRNLLMVKALPQAQDILELPKEQIETLSKQGEGVIEEKLFRFINQLSEAENKIKLSSQPTIIFEMELIKLCKNAKGKTLEGLIERIELLEKGTNKYIHNSIQPDKDINKAEDRLVRDKTVPKGDPISIPEQSKDTKTEDKPKKERPKNLEVPADKGLISINDIKNRWQDILKEVKNKKVQVEALLKEGKPQQFNENRLIISFDLGFHQAKLSEKENIELLEKVISGVMGSLVKVECAMKDQLINQDQEEDPVKVAIEVFGEDIVEVVDDEDN